MTWTITEAKADWTAVQQTVINTQLQLVTSTEANALKVIKWMMSVTMQRREGTGFDKDCRKKIELTRRGLRLENNIFIV